MKILIIGGTGMLGHKLAAHLSEKCELWITVRDRSKIPAAKLSNCQNRVVELDVHNLDRTSELVSRIKPDVIINCVGLIKQLPGASDPVQAIEINAKWPHLLARIAERSESRVIHFSTDCVFDGKKGMYTEDDMPNATDLYGRTKALGELSNPPHLTIRSSIIGREVASQVGLIEWFIAQKDKTIKGYSRAVYSGFTTAEMARIVEKIIFIKDPIYGVWHVSSSPISKFDLLQIAAAKFNWSGRIEEDCSFHCDRSLNSDRFRTKLGYQPPAWDAMIAELAEEVV